MAFNLHIDLSEKIRAIERKIYEGYVLKERAAQVVQQQADRMEVKVEKEEEKWALEKLQKELSELKQREQAEKQAKQNCSYDLLKCQLEKKMKKTEFENEQREEERLAIKRIVGEVEEERIREIAHRLEKIQLNRKDMLYQIKLKHLCNKIDAVEEGKRDKIASNERKQIMDRRRQFSNELAERKRALEALKNLIGEELKLKLELKEEEIRVKTELEYHLQWETNEKHEMEEEKRKFERCVKLRRSIEEELKKREKLKRKEAIEEKELQLIYLRQLTETAKLDRLTREAKLRKKCELKKEIEEQMEEKRKLKKMELEQLKGECEYMKMEEEMHVRNMLAIRERLLRYHAPTLGEFLSPEVFDSHEEYLKIVAPNCSNPIDNM